MARTTLVGPMYRSQEFNTGVSAERGMSPLEIVENLNTMFTELYAASADGVAGVGDKYLDVTITSAQLLALFTTPITILAAPGAGFAHVIEGISAYKAAGTAYAGIAAGEDLMVSYTNAAGLQVGQIETTGFLDQATAQHRFMKGYGFVAAAPVSSITPVDNGAVVISLLVGNITTGNSDLKLRIYYRTIPTVF